MLPALVVLVEAGLETSPESQNVLSVLASVISRSKLTIPAFSGISEYHSKLITSSPGTCSEFALSGSKLGELGCTGLANGDFPGAGSYSGSGGGLGGIASGTEPGGSATGFVPPVWNGS